MIPTIYVSKQLHYQDGHSDKVYNVTIEEVQPALYVVNFAYGRRGSTLQTGTKTSKPTGILEAEKIARKLITEKLNKGYVDVSAGQGQVNIVTVPKAKAKAAVFPMLLIPIDEDEVEQYLEDDNWIMQEKIDGERRMIETAYGMSRGLNRKGQEVALPATIEQAINKISLKKLGMIFDGEQIGDDYHVFDLLGESTSNALAFKKRHEVLLELINKYNTSPHIHLVKAAQGFAAKSKLYEKLKADNKEGVVFKHQAGLYTPGRTQDAVKYKFYETASFVVSALNAQRSVQIAVMAGDACLPVGNVTIPVNHAIPKIGAVVEVRYLYAYAEGSVYQPVYLGERSDISPSDCSMSQLKYKPNISLI